MRGLFFLLLCLLAFEGCATAGGAALGRAIDRRFVRFQPAATCDSLDRSVRPGDRLIVLLADGKRLDGRVTGVDCEDSPTLSVRRRSGDVFPGSRPDTVRISFPEARGFGRPGRTATFFFGFWGFILDLAAVGYALSASAVPS